MEVLGTMLTCKSLVRVVCSGERPIEQSGSWFTLKFPLGKQIVYYRYLCIVKLMNKQMGVLFTFTILSNFKLAFFNKIINY